MTVEAEGAHHLGEPAGLFLQAFGGSGGFFNQGCILLRHLVELGDGPIDLSDARALL
jgi:hypothetical protein